MSAQISTFDRLDDHANARLAAIVDSSFDAVISKDLNSVIRSWNPAAQQLFGYTADEAIGHSILMLIPESHRDEEVEIIRRIRKGERVETYETIRLRKDGTLVPVSLTVSPIRNSTGAIVGASKIARDISAAKASEDRIKILLREVNHRVKNQYAVILSIIRETVKRAETPADIEGKLRERIMGLANSHDLLVNQEWSGASLADLVVEQLRPFEHEGLVMVAGPLLTVSPNAVQNLGMAFHELATNSAKYGVLGMGAGSIHISWGIRSGHDEQPEFELIWQEDAPDTVALVPGAGAPRIGFGTMVLKRVTPEALGGRSSLDRTSAGVIWKIAAPLEQVVSTRFGI